jgi:hypothetical protein
MGIKAVHVFRFQAADGGTLARSEESWEGLLASLLKGYGQSAQGLQPQGLGQGHPQRSCASEGRGRAASRDGVSGLRGGTLTVRFLCELAMLAALAYWGFSVGAGVGAWVLGLGAPLLHSPPHCSTPPRSARETTERPPTRIGCGRRAL